MEKDVDTDFEVLEHWDREAAEKAAELARDYDPDLPDYLRELLDAYWFAPPVALWRAVELRAMAAKGVYEPPLLDLGCGDGKVARVLFGTGGKVDVGLDIWPEQLRQAADSDVYRHVDMADAASMPYPDAFFATVVSNSVLEHIPDVLPVVREVRRVLAPGGHFVFSIPSDAFREFLDGYVQRRERGDIKGAEAYATAVDTRLAHYHYFAQAEWQRLLGAAGLEMVEAHYYMPQQVEQEWDRMNGRYGIGRWSPWKLLVSSRLRFLGYQDALRRWVVDRLSEHWRSYYEIILPPGEKGGGMIIVARRESRWY